MEEAGVASGTMGPAKMATGGLTTTTLFQWALGRDDSGPVEFVPKGYKGEEYQYYVYGDGTKIIRGYEGKGHMIRFIGEEGEVRVSRGDKLDTDPVSLKNVVLKPSDKRLYESSDHRADWLNAIRSRKQPICHVGIGHHCDDLPFVWNFRKVEASRSLGSCQGDHCGRRGSGQVDEPSAESSLRATRLGLRFLKSLIMKISSNWTLALMLVIVSSTLSLAGEYRDKVIVISKTFRNSDPDVQYVARRDLEILVSDATAPGMGSGASKITDDLFVCLGSERCPCRSEEVHFASTGQSGDFESSQSLV